MRKTFLFVTLCTLLVIQGISQSATRKLPGVINHPSLTVSSPYISADGNALLFLANTGQDGILAVNYTSRDIDWANPVELPKHLSSPLTFMRGYGLSADGKKIYITSTKSPVIGGYDILVAELKGSTWSQPQNLGLPINSKLNDGCASVTPDGNTMYFMRCTKMDMNSADGCRIFKATQKYGRWEEPVELPANINTGNSQAPRIMADGTTLIFSSNKMPGTKGGMDLYESRFLNGAWSNPVPLDFVNTEKDDQYVSVAAQGRYLLKETPGARKNTEITEFLIPQELRPKGLMRIEGKITGAEGAPVPAYIYVTNLATHKVIATSRPLPDGSYFLYLEEGARYEVSIDPEASNLSFFSKFFDLTGDIIPQGEKVNVVLRAPEPGTEVVMETVTFKPFSSVLEPSSDEELKRLVRMIKANPAVTFEIQVLLNGYQEDSLRSNPDLTEMFVDSVIQQMEKTDSLGQLIKRDTVIARTTFHNNRTDLQGKAIIAFLVANGVNEKSIRYFGNAVQAINGDRKKLTVKAVVVKK